MRLVAVHIFGSDPRGGQEWQREEAAEQKVDDSERLVVISRRHKSCLDVSLVEQQICGITAADDSFTAGGFALCLFGSARIRLMVYFQADPSVEFPCLTS